MLKKRILASSMASVMALSAVSVVAFADETATDFGESVNKAELKEYVKSFDNFLKDGVYECSTKQAQQFQDAYDYADNVASKKNATEEESTAAYQMLKKVYESIRPYSAEELQALIDDCTDDYETENVLNADLGDNIWTTGSYANFEEAYDTATKYVDSEDGRLITDAYLDLADAHKNLSPLGQVKKSEFRSVLRDFEAIATKAAKYETWRRGKVSYNATTGTNDGSKKLTDAFFVTYDELYNIVYENSQTALVKNKKLEALKAGTTTWIDTGASGTVEGFVEDQYERFDEIQSSNVTTDVDIKAAYDAAVEAVKVFESWTADDTDRAAKASINNTINDYRTKLVDAYLGQATATDILGIMAAYTNFDAGYTQGDMKWKVNANNTEIVLDRTTNLIAIGADGKAVTVAAKDDTKHIVKKLTKGTDIMPYIPVKASDIAAGDTDVKAAFTIVEAYAAAEAGTSTYAVAYAAGLDDLDENGIVAEPAGSRNEYTLLNRFLSYALADKFPADDADKTYTRKQVKELIDKAYDLCDDTGDSEVFSIPHLALVEARKEALDWVTAANAVKGYKDGDAVDSGFNFNGDEGDATDDETATTVYKYLEKKYNDLNKEYKAYPVSYGEIADYIAEVGIAIDEGSLKATDAVISCLNKVAIGLSTLEATEATNQVFTSDREFISYNRLQVAKNLAGNDASKAEKALYDNLKNLETAVADAEKEPEKPEVVKGDLDGDGKYSPADARAALELFLAGEYNEAADMDGNGIVNAKDARAILELWLQA